MPSGKTGTAMSSLPLLTSLFMFISSPPVFTLGNPTLSPSPVKLPILGGGSLNTKPGAYPPTCVCRPLNWLLGSRARNCGGGTRGEVVKIMSSGRTIDGFRTIIVVEFPLGWKSQSARKGNGSLTGVVSRCRA